MASVPRRQRLGIKSLRIDPRFSARLVMETLPLFGPLDRKIFSEIQRGLKTIARRAPSRTPRQFATALNSESGEPSHYLKVDGIERWIRKGSPASKDKSHPYTFVELVDLYTWARSVLSTRGIDVTRLDELFRAHEHDEIALLGRLRQRAGHVSPGVLCDGAQVFDVNDYFDKLRSNLLPGHVYVVASPNGFLQYDEGSEEGRVGWTIAAELFKRSVSMELIGIGASSRRQAAHCVRRAKLKSPGHLMRAVPTPDAVSQLVIDNGRMIVFDRLPVELQKRDGNGLLLQSETRSALENEQIEVFLGMPATVHGGFSRIWIKLSPSLAEQPVHQIRQQRDDPSRLPDAAHYREAHLIQPEALAERQVRELGRGDSVTVITGRAFLEVASRFTESMKDLEHRTVRDTLACVAKGVSYRYVALTGSEAARSLVHMRAWIDSLSNNPEEMDRMGIQSGEFRQRFLLEVADKQAAEACLPWQRIVLLDQAHPDGGPRIRQMFVSAEGADVDDHEVMFYYVPSEKHRTTIDRLLPNSRTFLGKTRSGRH